MVFPINRPKTTGYPHGRKKYEYYLLPTKFQFQEIAGLNAKAMQ